MCGGVTARVQVYRAVQCLGSSKGEAFTITHYIEGAVHMAD